MKITLVSPDDDHFAWFGEEFDLEVLNCNDFQPGGNFLVVFAGGARGARARHDGLTWLQRYRKEKLSHTPALVYSFESRESLARRFSMLERGMPGIAFLRLPFLVQEIAKYAHALKPLTQRELQTVIRWHCGLQSKWKTFAHDIGNALRNWPAQSEKVSQLTREWGESVRMFAPDQWEALEDLERAVILGKDLSPAVIEIRAYVDRLERGLCSAEAGSFEYEIPQAPHRRPPRGLSSIAIADDHGYELDTIDELRTLGYAIGGPAENVGEAKSLLQYWAPSVLLADLNFPSRFEGLAIINEALAANCLVIAVSRAAVEPGELPDGVEDCCGALNFQSAERIHRLIWQHALSRGITSHE